jgi:hypothetical protein
MEQPYHPPRAPTARYLSCGGRRRRGGGGGACPRGEEAGDEAFFGSIGCGIAEGLRTTGIPLQRAASLCVSSAIQLGASLLK